MKARAGDCWACLMRVYLSEARSLEASQHVRLSRRNPDKRRLNAFSRRAFIEASVNGSWQEGVRVHSGTDPRGETTLDPWLDDPFPDYDTEPVWRSPPPETPAAPECASRTPCSAAPSPPATVFDFRAHFCHSAPMETHAFSFRLPANAPDGEKPFPISRLPSVQTN